MNYSGIITGLFTLFAIGLGFAFVIKLEHFVGACVKKIVLILSVILMLTSLYFSSFITASIIGIFSGTLIWGTTEMDEQEERALERNYPRYTNKYCDKLKVKKK